MLSDWVLQASESEVTQLQEIADTIEKHSSAILAIVHQLVREGINNKTKDTKCEAYGFRDMDFFKLKIFSLHDSNYAFIGCAFAVQPSN